MRIAPSLAVVLVIGRVSVAQAGGDPAAGKTKSLACQACHLGASATSDAPHLAGQRAGYLSHQLTAFRDGSRTHDAMTPIAKQLSDTDIDDLAAYWSAQAVGSDTTIPAAVTAFTHSPMPFPAGFPTGYIQYATKNDDTKVSKSYVNAALLAAAKAKQPLPDGSRVVVVTYSAKLDAAKHPIVNKDGSWQTDQIVSYAAMEAHAGWGAAVPELLRNGNWSYNVFGADQKPRAELNIAVCLACHKPAAASSYVFTLPAIQTRAAQP